MKHLMLPGMLALCASIVCHAGTLAKGQWTPSGCGTKPVPPVIDSSSVDNYNRSIKTINDWQKRTQDYQSCFIKEANADNAAIARAANMEQTKLKADFDKVGKDAADGKAKLDRN